MPRKSETPRGLSGTGGASNSSPGQKSEPIDSGEATPAQELREPIRTVCDGLVTLGWVFAAGDQVEAVLASGQSLGFYPTAVAGARAICGWRNAELVE